MSRFVEFFEGDNCRLSMTRLGMFSAFFPATYVLIVNAESEKIGDILLWYLGAFVTGYIGGKLADMGISKGGKNASLGG